MIPVWGEFFWCSGLITKPWLFNGAVPIRDMFLDVLALRCGANGDAIRYGMQG